jgi:RHS repeat-associated protein
VVNGSTAYGTVYPFISQAVESRWEDGAGHLTTVGSSLSSDPENLFVIPRPTGAHITITAQSWFDSQDLGSAPQTTLPPQLAGFNPSDTDSSGQNTVAGTYNGTYNPNVFDSLPGKITYGNLCQLKTDYGDGNTENVVNDYGLPGGVPAMGLPDHVTTTVTSGGVSETAPVKRYHYWSKGATQTPLVQWEQVDAGAASPNADSGLTTKTTYTRDERGRVTNTAIEGTNLQYQGQGSVPPYTTYSATSFDDRFDLPTTTQDAYGHTTTTVYDQWLALPTSVTDCNSVIVTTTYDALGRVVQKTNTSLNLTTTNTYSWDASDSVSAPGALPLPYKYSVRTATTVQPAVTTYYDRLGRAIRTIKEGFGSQQIRTDTGYNLLGQVVASSLPYTSGPLWTTTTYDALGRVSTATAPNGTVTTNAYKGRVTQATVVAPGVSLSQTNTTLVDAKGRTIAVWNPLATADNVPTFSDNKGSNPSSSASVAFALDGFGRMRQTTLKDQTPVITATYDALGRQLTLNDPDKGNWVYTNSALGHVLRQTDARGTVTSSTFDQLGRQLTRTTTETAGPVETAKWYYYDVGPIDTILVHTVAKGQKGWLLAPEREETVTTNGPGYAAANSASKIIHYYDAKGRPNIDLATIDGKFFYTCTDYDDYSRVAGVRHFWRPSGHEDAANLPYVWQDFGYAYTYDSKSYLLALADSTSPSRTWWAADAIAGYDFRDRPVLVKKGSGHWTQRTYRPEDGVLTAIKTGPSAGSTSVQNLSFNYDGLGNLTSRSGSGGSETLTYDNLNRLTNSTKQGAISYYGNGNIRNKVSVTGATTADYTYDAAHPHAVSSAFGYAMGYDVNGNLLTRTKTGETWTTRWAGFDKPRWMARAVGSVTTGSEFLYNANRSRTIQLEFDHLNTSQVPDHYVRKRVYAMGSTLEINYTNSMGQGVTPDWKLKKVRIYVPGPDDVIGAREFDPALPPDKTETALVYHYDHLGSIESITPFGSTTATYANDDSGKSGRFSEDPWGQRRNPLTWTGAPSTTDDGGADSLTPRGYTGHEMLDDLGLVHMNGRIYDPLLGRFLSADIVVQFPGSLQSYNRYSYVVNNPLSLIDPTGFFVDIQGTDEQKKKIQEAIDKQFKQKDGSYTAQYQKLLDSKDFGISIKFAEGKTASASASAAADKAQPSDQPGKDRVADASVKSDASGKISSTSGASKTSGTTVQFNKPTGEGTASESSTLPNGSSTGGETVTTLAMSYDQDSNTLTFGINYQSEIGKNATPQAQEAWTKDEVAHQTDFSRAYSSFQKKVGAAKLPASLSLDKAVSFFGQTGIRFRNVAEATARFWDAPFKGQSFNVNGSAFTGTGWHGGELEQAGAMVIRPGGPSAKEVEAFRAALEK